MCTHLWPPVCPWALPWLMVHALLPGLSSGLHRGLLPALATPSRSLQWLMAPHRPQGLARLLDMAFKALAGPPLLLHYPPLALWSSPQCLQPLDAPSALAPPTTHLSLLITMHLPGRPLERSGPSFKAQLRHHLLQEGFLLLLCTEPSLPPFMLIF